MPKPLPLGKMLLAQFLRPTMMDKDVAIKLGIRACSIQKYLGPKEGAKHHQCKSTEYTSWRAMRRRCRGKNATNFRWYGARGITICERWNNFRNFLADMGKKPDPKLTIERIDNSKGYEPGNCKWATRQEQLAHRNKPVFTK